MLMFCTELVHRATLEHHISHTHTHTHIQITDTHMHTRRSHETMTQSSLSISLCIAHEKSTPPFTHTCKASLTDPVLERLVHSLTLHPAYTASLVQTSRRAQRSQETMREYLLFMPFSSQTHAWLETSSTARLALVNNVSG